MPAAVKHPIVAELAAKSALEAAAAAAAHPLPTVVLLQDMRLPADVLRLDAEEVVWVRALIPL